MSATSRIVTLQEAADILLAKAEAQDRLLVAIVGAPGSGKSTLAQSLAAMLSAGGGGAAAILPMDGYHYDDIILNERGMRQRKGASDTFDVGGLAHMLKRLRDNREAEIYVPVFDRTLEIARAAARVIRSDEGIILVEGNYLLLDEHPWNDLAPLFDVSIMIRVAEDELRRRLTRRWQKYGISEPEIPLKVEQNDLPNGRFVNEKSSPADLVIEN
ncbi:nucleoside triphosphate hydrolase [uncultured Cohaesibacter sp.]|uniref:nucleoside triphosphate hydrolase n=1 Tax=uncultured Cohaesibacter sp. TaxID=1002546 RepID=UPI0029C64312|nr:nucleoside triphosphate hydrolase [uncultured Cohaesibacter sp.]